VSLRADDTETAVKLIDAGVTNVNVTDFLASEQFGETLQRIVTDDSPPETLRQQNRRLLRERVSDSGITDQYSPNTLVFEQ